MDSYGSLSQIKMQIFTILWLDDLDSYEKLEDLTEEHKKPGSEENENDGKNQLSQSTCKHSFLFYWGALEMDSLCSLEMTSCFYSQKYSQTSCFYFA